MVEQSDAELLFFEDEFADAAWTILERTDVERAIRIGDDGTVPEGTRVESYDRVLDRDPDVTLQLPDSPEAGITFTSGTTGRPKGVVVDQEMAYFASTEVVMEFGLGPTDVGGVITPFYHVITPYTWILPHFQVGACVCLQQSFDPADTLRMIEEHDVTTLMGVSTQMKELLSNREDVDPDLGSLARIRNAGPIEAETVERVREDLCDSVHITYGFTEAMGNVLHSYPHEQREYPGVTGRPGLNWTVRLVEAAKSTEQPDPDATVEPGERGEILAKGPTSFDGYLDRPGATEEMFVDGWLRPGDVAKLDEEGHYRIIGRIDNMIVSGGVNIYPQEVERRLKEHPDVESVAVIGVPDETWGQAVKAVVVGDADEEELDSFCRSHGKLANHKRPRYYEFADELPRSPTGLARERIREQYG